MIAVFKATTVLKFVFLTFLFKVATINLLNSFSG